MKNKNIYIVAGVVVAAVAGFFVAREFVPPTFSVEGVDTINVKIKFSFGGFTNEITVSDLTKVTSGRNGYTLEARQKDTSFGGGVETLVAVKPSIVFSLYKRGKYIKTISQVYYFQ